MFRCKNEAKIFCEILVLPFKERRKWDKSEFEHCIICHKIVPTRKDTPLDKRAYYVIGAGQVCYYCYEDIYGFK